MFKQLILNLTKRLYPKGRAFRIPFGGSMEKFHKALAESENDAYSDALSILDSLLPDNANFSEADATEWERRLGLLTDETKTLAQRKELIEKKINHPGNIVARQHYLNLERELRAAGFDVYVHENLLGVSPDSILGTATTMKAVHRTGMQHGQVNHGEKYQTKVVNSELQSADNGFVVTSNYKMSFFIGGEILGEFADVDAARETEFRQLILKIKPAQTVGYLFINYI
jgi:hypothetical protein